MKYYKIQNSSNCYRHYLLCSNPTQPHLSSRKLNSLRNFGSLPQHYTASQRRRWRQHGSLKRWYPTTTLDGFTTQKVEAAWTSNTFVSYHNTTWDYNPESGGSTDLWNGVMILKHYSGSWPRGRRLEFWRLLSWNMLRYRPTICLDRLRKSPESSVKVAGVWVEIRNLELHKYE
jgi:hypothetical protein